LLAEILRGEQVFSILFPFQASHFGNDNTHTSITTTFTITHPYIMTASPINKTKTNTNTKSTPITNPITLDVQSPTTDDVTPEDILSETQRLSAALETFCDLLKSKQSNLASAYQTYEALWNHYILLLRLFDDYRWKSRMGKELARQGQGQQERGEMVRQIERGFTRLLPIVKQAKVALNTKMKDAAQVLAVVQSTEGDNKGKDATVSVHDLPETAKSPIAPKPSRFSLFRIGTAPRRRVQDGITATSSGETNA
jgi:hypothetical protein